MKKYMLLFVLFSNSISHAYYSAAYLANLEQAIQDSNPKQVTALLPKIQLSEQEKARLIYLSDDVLSLRRVKTITGATDWSDVDKHGTALTMVGLAGFAGGFLYHMHTVFSRNFSTFGIKLAIGSGFLILGSGIYSGIKTRSKIKKQYEDALKIKQLMLGTLR